MISTDSKEPVVFLLGEGGPEVSNDPRWHDLKLRERIAAENDEDVDLDSAEEKTLHTMTAAELKAEVARLREAGTEVDTSGIKKKSELVAAIEKAIAEDRED